MLEARDGVEPEVDLLEVGRKLVARGGDEGVEGAVRAAEVGAAAVWAKMMWGSPLAPLAPSRATQVEVWTHGRVTRRIRLLP